MTVTLMHPLLFSVNVPTGYPVHTAHSRLPRDGSASHQGASTTPILNLHSFFAYSTLFHFVSYQQELIHISENLQVFATSFYIFLSFSVVFS